MNPSDLYGAGPSYTNLDNISDNSWTLQPEHEELKNLLSKWGFPDLLPLFEVQEINLQRLKLLTGEDVKELLCNYSLGLRVEFREKLLEWKADVGGISTASTSGTLSIASSTRSSLFQKPWNILEIIKNFPNGQYVLNYFDFNKKLDDASRKIVVDSIIAYHFENSKKINRDQFFSISKEIEELFNDDQQIYYKINSNQVPSGRLYDKYYNSNKRLKKLGLLKFATATKETREFPESDSLSENEIPINTEEQETFRLWLAINLEPWDEVKQKWKETFELRRNHFMEDSNNKCTALVELWPLIKHPHGFTLIDLDFVKLFPDQGFNLIKYWQSFKDSIIPILNHKIKDKQNINVLKTVNTANDKNDSSYDLLIGLLLHALLPPTIRHTKVNNTKKVITKATIKDSQDSFFIHVLTANDFERKIFEHRQVIIKRNGTIQPLIIGIGEELRSIQNFYVYFDNIKYKFDNFLSALDVCFKIHHVMHLKYSSESELVWTFIQNQIYKIKTSFDISNANLLCLLNDLNK